MSDAFATLFWTALLVAALAFTLNAALTVYDECRDEGHSQLYCMRLAW